ncbi:hypothetical protein HYALB_00007121 [Hymenoscyphus albidus]|uniref:Pyruvate decarboxylase n=1 Tax=Hymenoscyphus albidus TaxID=595503 RepID=A0A9N9QCF2_9HELO|nr:hypothetical protein HYALB_00007121 [Hymenoscyphus albidus]
MKIASSDPKGPAYITGAREVLAEKTEQPYRINANMHKAIGPAALPQDAVETIVESLVKAQTPLIITGYSGRIHACPEQLVKLAEAIPGLRILDTGGCHICFPADHPSYVGFRLSFEEVTTKADVILVLDCDVPWIPSRNPPREDAKIYFVDVDPLNASIGFSFLPANGRWKADGYTAMAQLNRHLSSTPKLQNTLKDEIYKHRWENLQKIYSAKVESLSKLSTPATNGSLDIHHVGFAIKTAVPKDTIFVVEAATCAMSLSDQIQANVPAIWINSGGAGLGWSGGAALGVKLAHNASGAPKFICQVVGDGCFLFSEPSSVYWIASRYNIPVLTIVLNNKGWNAPRRSHDLVHPKGLGATVINKEMHISLDPSPDYGGIAKAAAGSTFGATGEGLFTGKARTADELKLLLEQAVASVKSGKGALIEAVLAVDEKGDSLIQK